MQPFSFHPFNHTVLENKKQIYIYLHPNLKILVYITSFQRYKKNIFHSIKMSIFSLGLKSNFVDCVVFTDLCATSSEEKQGAVVETHSFK